MTHDEPVVLIVDDEDPIRNMLQRALERAAYHTLTAASGQAALNMMSSDESEIVLLDIRMPGLSGMEVLGRLVADFPDACAIMMTGMADIQISIEAMKAGAYDFMLKPFDLEDLMLRVRRALERRYLLLQTRQHQRNLEREVKEKADLMQAHFAELIQGLAREHTMALELEALRKPKRGKGVFSSLPPELQQPKASVQEFVEALLQTFQAESGKSNQNDHLASPALNEVQRSLKAIHDQILRPGAG